jgi:DNA polymerase III gamma/tau subunit
MLEVTDDELEELKNTSAAYSVETLAALFELLLEGLETVSFSQQPRLALELTFHSRHPVSRRYPGLGTDLSLRQYPVLVFPAILQTTI